MDDGDVLIQIAQDNDPQFLPDKVGPGRRASYRCGQPRSQFDFLLCSLPSWVSLTFVLFLYFFWLKFASLSVRRTLTKGDVVLIQTNSYRNYQLRLADPLGYTLTYLYTTLPPTVFGKLNATLVENKLFLPPSYYKSWSRHLLKGSQVSILVQIEAEQHLQDHNIVGEDFLENNFFQTELLLCVFVGQEFEKWKEEGGCPRAIQKHQNITKRDNQFNYVATEDDQHFFVLLNLNLPKINSGTQIKRYEIDEILQVEGSYGGGDRGSDARGLDEGGTLGGGGYNRDNGGYDDGQHVGSVLGYRQKRKENNLDDVWGIETSFGQDTKRGSLPSSAFLPSTSLLPSSSSLLPSSSSALILDKAEPGFQGTVILTVKPTLYDITYAKDQLSGSFWQVPSVYPLYPPIPIPHFHPNFTFSPY
eukprot:TRINITY_DN1338_c0_g1_i11.p1 TRINITY_DN1338_c0_g1~~TRINITY_DN1338_c0_g1_i11.p1  ORF type:complete len:417 (-),score=69.65 TRINITY_DN1338_c0_g1_i11:532-1782(-)